MITENHMDRLNKKVLLIRQNSPNHSRFPTSYALALLSAILEPIVDIKILDNNGKYRSYTDRDILGLIQSFKPDIIGFNINIFNAFNTYELIISIKNRFPEVLLIAGGIHTNHCSYEILKSPVIVVKGEGDLSFPNLIKKLDETYFRNNKKFDKDVYNEISRIKGILFRNDKGEVVDTGTADVVHDLDTLPFISYKNYNLSDFVKIPRDGIGSTNAIISQRGCPYSCIFCKSNDFGGKIRETSPEYLIRYIEHLYSKYSYKHIYFLDNNFTLTKKRIMNFCKLFIQSGLSKKVSLECQTNILCPLDDEVLSLMVEANFLRVQFGLDRLTEYGAKKARIRSNNDLLMPKLKLLETKNMKTFISVLLGMDFDNKDSIEAEYKEVGKIKNFIQIVSVGAVIPIPGTELYLRHPEVKEWYLKDNFVKSPIHYYDTALTGDSKVLALNLFNLRRDILRQILKVQLYGLKINTLSLFGKKGLIIFYVDKILILISYYLSKLSPNLEVLIFKFIRVLRLKLVSIVYDLVYYEKERK